MKPGFTTKDENEPAQAGSLGHFVTIITYMRIALIVSLRGARLLSEATVYQAQLTAGWAKAMEQMGISGEPIGEEKAQEMIAAYSIKPEDNEFSRGIIAM